MGQPFSKSRFWTFFAPLLVLSFLILHQISTYSFVRFNLSNSHSATFKLYWTTEVEPYWSESKSAKMAVLGRKRHHILPISVPISDIRKIRIDPSTRRGVKTILRELHFHHLNDKTVSFKGKDALAKFEPNDHVIKLQRGEYLSFKSAANDPHLTSAFPATPSHSRTALRLLQSLLLAITIFVILKSLPWWFRNFRWVPAGMALAGMGVLLMATISAKNTHPDEKTHLTNAQYYSNHYSPPVACSDDVLYTYTAYGVSRLDNREISYYVGGRYLQAVAFLPAEDQIKLRYLNVILFFILVLLAFRQSKSRLLFMPLLLTPQAWYLFSYYNSDALSLFVVVLTAYQVFVSDSMLRRLLRGDRPPTSILWVFALSLLFAMQYWVKLNYIFYPLFLLMLGVSWWLLNRRKPDLKFAMPVLCAFIMGSSLFASWEVSRHAINDYSLSEKTYNCREKTADDHYKPSTPLAETHPNYNLRSKGISILEMITDPERSWVERIFYTGLGAYGYLEFLNNYTHYEIVSALVLLLFLSSILTITIKGDGMARMSLLSMLAAMGGITFAAMLNNWDQDYQPQGRYLMVYLPLFGSILALNAKRLNLTLVNSLAWLAFVLAMYSFFAVGLVEIPKV